MTRRRTTKEILPPYCVPKVGISNRESMSAYSLIYMSHPITKYISLIGARITYKHAKGKGLDLAFHKNITIRGKKFKD